MSIIKELKIFVLNNKKKIFLIGLLYLSATSAIGIVNYPYIDDIGRQLYGTSGFAHDYSRYLSEFSSTLIQGQRHLTDLGLTTHIISALILTVCSTLVVFILFNKRSYGWFTFLAATVIGINPWYLEPLSFRFDSPYISLSILCTIVPFLFWNSKNRYLLLFSIVGIFLMCNSYQASSGIFIMMALSLFYLNIREGGLLKASFKKLMLAGIGFVIGVLLYLLQLKIKPPYFSEAANIGPVQHLPGNIIRNLSDYFNNIIAQSSKIWLVLFIGIIVVFLISSAFQDTKLNLKFLGLSVLLTFLLLVFSFGIYMIFPTSLSLVRPRYEFGFGFFLSLLMMLSTSFFSFNWLSYLSKTLIGLLVFYFVSFTFVYANALYQQNEVFKSQSIILGTYLNDLVDSNSPIVKVNRFIPNSLIYENTAFNYPILPSLIMPNTNVSWDTRDRFKSITNLPIEFELINEFDYDFSSMTLAEDTMLYAIYQSNNDIYVIWK